jgi:hypothetical protein
MTAWLLQDLTAAERAMLADIIYLERSLVQTLFIQQDSRPHHVARGLERLRLVDLDGIGCGWSTSMASTLTRSRSWLG